MKVYVSSTFVDLAEHRAAAIRILRQLGHEVVAMEDYVADSNIPLEKVLEDVEGCDAYVGIFAWRYGFAPGAAGGTSADPALAPSTLAPRLVPLTDGKYGETSITEWEYLQARADSKRPVLAFLLEEGVPWPPHFIDGFESGSNAAIVKLRERLQLERLVAYFRSPEDLEARVSAAITTVNMSARVAVNLLDPAASTPSDLSVVAQGPEVRDSGRHNFLEAVTAARTRRIVQIDIGTTWWSTRLFLLAFMLERLTDVRRILVLEDGSFAGLLATRSVREGLDHVHVELARFERRVHRARRRSADVRQEAEEVLRCWDQVLPDAEEGARKRDVSASNLRWWFGESLLTTPLHIADLGTATPLDLVRLLDFPGDFVPVVTTHSPATGARTPRPVVMVVDKAVLNAELARSYLGELLRQAGVRVDSP